MVWALAQAHLDLLAKLWLLWEGETYRAPSSRLSLRGIAKTLNTKRQEPLLPKGPWS